MDDHLASLDVFRPDNITRIDDHRTLLRFQYEGIDGAWILVSFGRDRHTDDRINRINREHGWGDEFHVNSVTTFFFDGGKYGAEWEPQHGPIQVWTSCDADWRGETSRGNPIKPRKHWFYEWVEDKPLNWSQLAVDREMLRQKLVDGDLEGVFQSLRKWTEFELEDDA